MNTLQLENARILLVTNDSAVRDVYRSAGRDGDILESREDETGAFELLAQEPVDLILLDAELESVSAWQFAERLQHEFPHIDFALLTNAEGSGADEVREEWIVDVLLRGLPPRQLSNAITRLIANRSLAWENRRLRDSLHLMRQCDSLTTCLEPGKVYPLALDLILEALSRSRGAAAFHRGSIPLNDAVAFRGLDDGEERRLRDLLVQKKPLAENQPDEIQVVEGGPLLSALSGAGFAVESILVVPVRGQQDESGVIWIFEDARSFEESELEKAGIVAGAARMALENSERYYHAKERAFIDDVTEVYNARYLLSTTENEIRRAERYEQVLSVLFLDLDRFKLVNDRHGHLVGSQTLRNLSQVLAQCVRDVDTLARYGGDEFTILLVGTDHGEAMSVAERIRRTVEDHVFEAGGEASLRLTVSVGVSTYPQHGADRNSLLDAADKAMYRSKSLGRNRVCSVDEIEENAPRD